MKMQPAYKDYLWGGENLVHQFGKKTAVRPVAESWEISCHPDGPSTIVNGVFAGKTLPEVLAQHPEMQGKHRGEFPILIKFIDALQNLSLQVHPNDDWAHVQENQQGKNEMWYVVDAKLGATLILGFKHAVTKQEIRQRIQDNTLLEIVRTVPVKTGDCYLIPAGLLHAIGAGTIIAEIQQNSNVTYRVYDYGRVDAAGNPRELHIDKAVEVIDSMLDAQNVSKSAAIQQDGFTQTPLSDWPYFDTQLLEIQGHATLDVDTQSFLCLTCISGASDLQGKDEKLALTPGESVFVPASCGQITLTGNCRVLATRMR